MLIVYEQYAEYAMLYFL